MKPTVTVEIPRDALTVIERPAAVSRVTSERVLGIPPKLFAELARDFARAGGRVLRAKRLVLVEVDPFVAWLRDREARTAPAQEVQAKPPADPDVDFAASLGLRVVAGGRR
jgi:hypothetical protein